MIIANAVRVDQWAWRCISSHWRKCTWLFCSDIKCPCSGFLVEVGDICAKNIEIDLENDEVLWHIIGTNDKIENADPMKIYEYCNQHAFQERP